MEYNTPMGQSTCRYKGERTGRHISKEGGIGQNHDRKPQESIKKRSGEINRRGKYKEVAKRMDPNN